MQSATMENATARNDVRETRDLRGNAAPIKVQFGMTGKILGALVALGLIGAVGAYAYQTAPSHHTAHQSAPSSSPFG